MTEKLFTETLNHNQSKNQLYQISFETVIYIYYVNMWYNLAFVYFEFYNYMHLSRVTRKPTFCICENKGADQLCSNCKANQRLCFRYKDSTIPLLSKSEVSIPQPSSVAVNPVCVGPDRKSERLFSHDPAHLIYSLLSEPIKSLFTLYVQVR